MSFGVGYLAYSQALSDLSMCRNFLPLYKYVLDAFEMAFEISYAGLNESQSIHNFFVMG